MSGQSRKRILATVIEKLSAAYPQREFTPEQIRLWYDRMGHLSEDVAIATANACIDHYKWMPSISEYLDLSRSIRRHQIGKAVEEPTNLSEYVQALQAKGLAVQRDLIARRSAQPNRQHNHAHGWEHCPVCSEAHSDTCVSCMSLQTHGLAVEHHKG